MMRFVVLPLILLLAVPAAAQTISEERTRLIEARHAEAEAVRRSQRYEAAAALKRGKADEVRARAVAVAARIQESEARIAAAQANLAIIDRLRARQRAALAQRQRPIAQLMAALQMMARRPSAMALFQPGSLDDVIHTRLLLETTVPVVRRNSAALRAEIARGNALRHEAEAAMAGLRQSQAELETRRMLLAQLEAERRIESRKLGDSAMLERERAQGMGEKASDIVQLMAQMDKDAGVSARLASLPGPVLRPSQPGQAAAPPPERVAAPSARPAYRLPVLGRVVTGMGEISDTGMRSRGLTFAPPPGAQVIAPAAGHVSYAGPFRGYGQIVIIDHGSGWTTLITGMESLSVAVGDGVMQGSPLGRCGASRPRIMVELRREGQPIDIAPLAVRG